MQTVLVTGSAGLIGSACARHFAGLGWRVHGIDNNARRQFFGRDGDTAENGLALSADLNRDGAGYVHHQFNVTLAGSVAQAVKQSKPALVIHAAAQPSHDYAAAHVHEDFETNALGTLNVLEAVRRHAPGAAVVYLSTNKVYGDTPNKIPLVELPTRFDYHPQSPYHRHGIDEYMSVDASTHSLFGCSKLYGDIITQEYGRYFGLKTAVFRCGCLTGAGHAGAELHGFLAYLARCCREGRPYTVHGHGGKQVRDQLHSSDVARAIEAVAADPPEPGSVYNLGGGRANSVSVLEAIALVEKATGCELDWQHKDEPRRGDHIVYISDNGRFKRRYPGWGVRVSMAQIVEDLCAGEKIPVLA